MTAGGGGTTFPGTDANEANALNADSIADILRSWGELILDKAVEIHKALPESNPTGVHIGITLLAKNILATLPHFSARFQLCSSSLVLGILEAISPISLFIPKTAVARGITSSPLPEKTQHLGRMGVS